MKTTPSKAAKRKANKGAFTIGIDLSDRTCVVCVLDVLGEVVESEKIKLERSELKALARKHPGSRTIIECGTHSPWVRRWLTKHGMDVVVANPRKLRAIWDASYETNKRDAELLARIGRVDLKLLGPIRHVSEDSQKQMLSMKMPAAHSLSRKRDLFSRSRQADFTASRKNASACDYDQSPSSA